MIRPLMALAFSALLLAGCMNKGAPLIPGSGEDTVWQTFKESRVSPDHPMISGSLRFGTADDTRRVTYTLWNSGSPADKSVRLQVSAGVGAVIAEALFDASGMLIVLPREGKAYIGKDTPENISRILGFSFPFKMSSLKDYLSGAYFTALDSPDPQGFDRAEDGSIVFHCAGHHGPMDVTLDADGRPSLLTHKGKWTLSVAYGDDALPRRLDGVLKGSEEESRLVLLVKDRKKLPHQAEAVLTVPEGFTVYDIGN